MEDRAPILTVSESVLQALNARGITLTRQIASGGMSEVYEGTRGAQRVAVKLLHTTSQASRSLIQALVREAELMQRLRHPNLLEVLDAGQASTDAYFIVMPYASGGTLRQYLANLKAQGKQMSELEALQIAHCVANALEYIHAQGIVHRDVKPSNILFLSQRTSAKLSDFGVAIEVEEALVRAKQGMHILVFGTPEYAAPEQAQGRADVRTDIYALGIVLYEMLAGAPPFRGRDPSETIALHANAPLPTLTRRVSPKTLQIIARATAKNPLHRFQSAHEMRQALERAIASLPIHVLLDLTRRGLRYVLPVIMGISAIAFAAACLIALSATILLNRIENHLGAERTWSFPPVGLENRVSQLDAQRIADQVIREATLGTVAVSRVALGPTNNRVELELTVLGMSLVNTVLWVTEHDGIPVVALVSLGSSRPSLISDALEQAVNRGLTRAWQRYGYRLNSLVITPSGDMIFTLVGPHSVALPADEKGETKPAIELAVPQSQ